MRVVGNLAILILLASPARAQDAVSRTDEQLHPLHQDSKTCIASLDDPQRDSYQKPNEVISALGSLQGERIADIGSGSGYFSLQFALHVGAGVQVYAVDANP